MSLEAIAYTLLNTHTTVVLSLLGKSPGLVLVVLSIIRGIVVHVNRRLRWLYTCKRPVTLQLVMHIEQVFIRSNNYVITDQSQSMLL
jgi:hypothetical protein